ncbi:MAG: mechanosensitive ion channel family protein [Candidatus Micrarchaeia archaeon]
MRLVYLVICVIVVLLLVYYFPTVRDKLGIPTELMVYVNKAVLAAVVIALAIVTLTLVEEWVRRAFKLSEDETRYISGVLKYFMGGLALLIMGFIFIGDVTFLTIFSGLVGAGLAIALQPILLNVIGWLSIVMSRLYKIGDRVYIGDSVWGALGDVSDINLFFTRINELDRNSWQETGGFVSVPNRIVLEKNVINYTAEGPFIWDEISFRISHGCDYELAKRITEGVVKEIVGEKMRDAAKFLSSRKYKLKIRDIKEEPIVYLSLRDGNVRVAVRYLVSARKRRQTEAKITERLMEELRKNRKIKIVG